MVENRSESPFLRLPINALEQLSQLPPKEQQQVVLDRLYGNVTRLLTEKGLSVNRERSASRLKSQERINAKLERRGTDKLILDIYGMQVILPENQIYSALAAIDNKYPTPEQFPGNVPSLRDYNKETEWNPDRQDDYKAVHKNIVFVDGTIGIAEIQLMTAEQQQLAKRNRDTKKLNIEGRLNEISE
jgi:hypothetical protein